MYKRYGIALGVGVAVTFGLLFIMQLLIANQRGELGPRREPLTLDFVRVIREPVVEHIRHRPEEPPEPQRPPETPTLSMDDFTPGIAVTVSPPNMSRGVDIGGGTRLVGDGDYLPMAKVQPIYPPSAAERGIEGYVIVEFTVTRAGNTRDIEIVESSHSVFHRSALEAASRFKYKPRVIDGVEVEVPGVRNRITFVLDR